MKQKPLLITAVIVAAIACLAIASQPTVTQDSKSTIIDSHLFQLNNSMIWDSHGYATSWNVGAPIGTDFWIAVQGLQVTLGTYDY